MEKIDSFEELIKGYPRILKFNVQPNSGALHNLRKNKNDKKEIIPFKLIEKKKINHDSVIFKFEIPDNDILGLCTGNHISISFTNRTFDKEKNEYVEEEVTRKYTPISQIDQKGSFEILIKIYRKDVDPKFPEGGLLTQWLEQQEIGNLINFRGPLGRFNYYGNGHFKLGFKPKPIRYITKQFEKIGLIAGGTGIAPIYHFIQEAFLKDEKLECHLLFTNRKEEDILLKETMEYISKKSIAGEENKQIVENKEENVLYSIYENGKKNKKENFFLKFHNILTRGGEEQSDYFKGKITKQLLSSLLPSPSENTLILMCGRGKMCKKYLIPILLELGYSEDSLFTF